MDKCQQHTRENIGLCMWCGKKLCEKCVAHQDGKKFYCEKCEEQLKPALKLQTQPIAQQTLIKKDGDTRWI